MDELAPGTSFRSILVDDVADPSTVERVVLLSGKMYYDLVKARSERSLDPKVAFIRIEVWIPPFPPARLFLTEARTGNLAVPLRRSADCSRVLPQRIIPHLGARRARKRWRLHLRQAPHRAGPTRRSLARLRGTASNGDAGSRSRELLCEAESRGFGQSV